MKVSKEYQKKYIPNATQAKPKGISSPCIQKKSRLASFLFVPAFGRIRVSPAARLATRAVPTGEGKQKVPAIIIPQERKTLQPDVGVTGYARKKKRVGSLPTLDPTPHRIQGWIIVEPMPCPQVGGSEVSNNMLVSGARQFLLQCGVRSFQGGRMLGCRPLATEDVRPSHSPSAHCRGA